jgi:hypothetical protein
MHQVCFLLCLTFTGVSFTQCRAPNCEPPLRLIEQRGDYVWYAHADAPGELYLYHHGRQIGAWNIDDAYYRALTGNEWGPMLDFAPIDPPGYRNHGVARTKLRANGDDCYCSINGQRVGFDMLRAVLEDDSAKLWLVVTGPGREKVTADFQNDPRNASLVKRTRIWSVHEKHHSLYDRTTKAPLGFPIGSPGIYFARADGTELYSQLGYHGPDDLEGLRKKDPDAPKPKKPEPDEPEVNPEKVDPRLVTLVAAGAFGVFFLLKGRQS